MGSVAHQAIESISYRLVTMTWQEYQEAVAMLYEQLEDIGEPDLKQLFVRKDIVRGGGVAQESRVVCLRTLNDSNFFLSL